MAKRTLIALAITAGVGLAVAAVFVARKPGARLSLRFCDGEVGATADGGGPAARQGRLAL